MYVLIVKKENIFLFNRSDIMGKNKLKSKNPSNSGNPIYKKVGAGAPLKTKNKAKQVKTNLKKVKCYSHIISDTEVGMTVPHTSSLS